MSGPTNQPSIQVKVDECANQPKIASQSLTWILSHCQDEKKPEILQLLATGNKQLTGVGAEHLFPHIL